MKCSLRSRESNRIKDHSDLLIVTVLVASLNVDLTGGL